MKNNIHPLWPTYERWRGGCRQQAAAPPRWRDEHRQFKFFYHF